MNDLNRLGLESKAFRDGQLIRPLDFAIRGMPRHFLTGEQFVDRDSALRVYEPEIRQLDALGIHSRWFSSGISGAALISLVIWPDTRALWQRFARFEIQRDERGCDGPALLYELVARHQNDDRLTRRHDYQLYLFECAMAIARAWNHHSDPNHRYLQLPPLPDIPELINRVRKKKGERLTKAGFRSPKTIRRSWVEPPRPQVVHDASMEDALDLAERALTLEPQHPGRVELESAAEWILAQNPSSEICHPAAMAAALVTLALDGACKAFWARALAGIGRRMPNGGRQPLRDIPMAIQDCIYEANRGKEPHRDAVVLYYRIHRVMQCWLGKGDCFHANLPHAPASRPLEALWRSDEIAFAPRIVFAPERPGQALGSDSDDGPEVIESGRNGSGYKPSANQARKRLKTGQLAEDWVRKNFETLHKAFIGATLEDWRQEASGFDFLVVTQAGIFYLEVKGMPEAAGRVALTDHQWHRAQLEGDRFFLVVVTGLGNGGPSPIVIRDPANSMDAELRSIKTVTRSWEIAIDPDSLCAEIAGS